MNTETTETTFNTWGRVAMEQMDRLSEIATQGMKMQTSAMEQGREYVQYHMKLATEWQSWAMDAGKKMTSQLWGSK